MNGKWKRGERKRRTRIRNNGRILRKTEMIDGNVGGNWVAEMPQEQKVGRK